MFIIIAPCFARDIDIGFEILLFALQDLFLPLIVLNLYYLGLNFFNSSLQVQLARQEQVIKCIVIYSVIESSFGLYLIT